MDDHVHGQWDAGVSEVLEVEHHSLKEGEWGEEVEEAHTL